MARLSSRKGQSGIGLPVLADQGPVSIDAHWNVKELTVYINVGSHVLSLDKDEVENVVALLETYLQNQRDYDYIVPTENI